MSVVIFTVAMYQVLFGINEKTARTWINQDKKKLGRDRLTYGHVKELYALVDSDFDSIFRPNSGK